MRSIFSTASLAVATLAAHAAGAHAVLERADPAAGARVGTPPSVIRLWFTETVEPKFSKLELMTADGAAVRTGPASVSPADRSEFDLPLAAPLAPGTYRVVWRVVSTDTHRAEGDFTFEVRP
jgi:hypothetical protein